MYRLILIRSDQFYYIYVYIHNAHIFVDDLKIRLDQPNLRMSPSYLKFVVALWWTLYGRLSYPLNPVGQSHGVGCSKLPLYSYSYQFPTVWTEMCGCTYKCARTVQLASKYLEGTPNLYFLSEALAISTGCKYWLT